MAAFIELQKNDSKVQNEISPAIEKFNKESYSTQSKIGHNALIQSKVFEQAIFIIFEDMDIEIEQKDNKIELSKNKVG